MIKFKQIINKPQHKEFLIKSGKYKGKYISYWVNTKSHIDLMENETTIFGECLYLSKSTKELSAKDIKTMANAILIHKGVIDYD
jgi:hypothetical protein